jgi:hypothetical protein
MAKKVKIKVVNEFLDRENHFVKREVGEEYEVAESRAKYLKELGFVSVIETEKPKKDK